MKLLLAIVSALALAGCGDEEPKVRQTAELVTFDAGGGIAAQRVFTLTVRRDGEATVVRRYHDGPKTTSMTLDDDELTDLEALVTAAAGTDVAIADTGCSDCFTYAVHATGIDVALDEVSLQDADPDLEALIRELSGMVPD